MTKIKIPDETCTPSSMYGHKLSYTKDLSMIYPLKDFGI